MLVLFQDAHIHVNPHLFASLLQYKQRTFQFPTFLRATLNAKPHSSSNLFFFFAFVFFSYIFSQICCDLFDILLWHKRSCSGVNADVCTSNNPKEVLSFPFFSIIPQLCFHIFINMRDNQEAGGRYFQYLFFQTDESFIFIKNTTGVETPNLDLRKDRGKNKTNTSKNCHGVWGHREMDRFLSSAAVTGSSTLQKSEISPLQTLYPFCVEDGSPSSAASSGMLRCIKPCLHLEERTFPVSSGYTGTDRSKCLHLIALHH